MNNSAIIASNASYLINALKEKINGYDYRIFSVNTESELKIKIKLLHPRMVFIENCFCKNETGEFIRWLAERNNILRIIVWSFSDVSPLAAARLVNAGADSYFSLRETEENIEMIANKIMNGQRYSPQDVINAKKDNKAFLPFEKMTNRETQIIRLNHKYKTNSLLAQAMALSKGVVKFHKANIYRKCGGDTAVDILIYGIRNGIILDDDLIA
jgi:DNA-binding NarL/FixJ family response regulator